MVYRDTMNAKTLIRFLRRLIKDVGRKLFLVVDNLRVHHSKLVHEWLEQHREQIEVFYLRPLHNYFRRSPAFSFPWLN